MTDWKAVLEARWDKADYDQLAEQVSMDEQLLEELFNTFCDDQGMLSVRSSFILARVFRKHPQLLIPRIGRLFTHMDNPSHEWYRWHVLWYLSHCKFPAEYDGLAATYAFEELGKPNSRPSVKNATMRLLEFICKRNPELIPEFKLYLEDLIQYERPTLVTKATKQLTTLSSH